MNKKNLIILFEFIIILVLVFLQISSLTQNGNATYADFTKMHKLLSPRIYAGLIEPNSHLIFNLNPLEVALKDYIEKNNLNVSVYILNMKDGSSMGINHNVDVEPASLNKLPLAMAVMKKVDNGELNLNDMLEIKPDDRDSNQGILFKSEISELSIKDLLRYLLSESDNTAAHVLSREVSMSDIEAVSNYLDFYGTDDNYTTLNIPYTITAKSTSRLFMSLYLSTFLEADSSEYILNLLSNSTFDINTYANLPKEIVIAQKYGNYIDNNGHKSFHDCGIIYSGDKRFFYCVMTQDLKSKDAIKVIGTIVNSLYNYIGEIQAKTKV